MQQNKLVSDLKAVIKRFQEAQKASVTKSLECVARAKSNHPMHPASVGSSKGPAVVGSFFSSSLSPNSTPGTMYGNIASDEDERQPFVQLQQRY